MCEVAPGGDVCGCTGGHVWLLWGACVVALGGVHGCSGGHAWLLGGACMVASGGRAWLLQGGRAWFFLGGGCAYDAMRYGQ